MPGRHCPGARAPQRSGCPASLQSANDVEAELGRPRTVDDTVVERDRDVPDACRNDSAVAHHRAIADPADAQNRDFGMIDDRRLQQAAELAGARDRERRAAQLLRRELSRACALSQAPYFHAELVDRAAV